MSRELDNGAVESETKMAKLKIDPTRLEHLEAIAKREHGAVTAAAERLRHLVEQRRVAVTRTTELRTGIANRWGARNLPPDDHAAIELEKVETREAESHRQEAAGQANHDRAYENWNAAGNLVRNCGEWLKANGFEVTIDA